jgi:UTP:GlnB (protein PII) uridylyltransferase
VTEGSKVMDSFYVTDLLHGKISEEQRLQKIKEMLLAMLEG